MRFVHAADLHLDSPFRGLGELAPGVAGRLRDATFQALDRLVALARTEAADCVLLAGDTYDGADRSIRAQVRLRDALAGLGRDGVESLLVLGNHDPADGWSVDLDAPGVFVFPPGEPAGRDIVVEGRRIGHVDGISYPTREVHENYALRLRRQDDAPASVALLHANVRGGITSESDYAPARLEDLVASGHDYWALGHVHSRQVLRAARPTVVYPGNTQGRSMRERGERGCYVVAVEDGIVRDLRFVPLQAALFQEERVDVAGTSGGGALTDLLLDRLQALRAQAPGRSLVVRLVLTGEATAAVRDVLADPARLRDLVATLRANAESALDEALVWPEGLADETLVPLAAPAPGTLAGDVLELAERALDGDLDGASIRAQARVALGPLYARAGLGFLAAEVDDETLGRWLMAAAERVVRGLAGEGGL